MKMRSILFIGIAGLLSACSTINYVGIETYNPAEVTFPENVAKVLIVNNAVPQPEDAGYEYTLQGEKQDTCKAKADSALFDACRTLGEAIVEASYFNDVLLYHDAVRKDNQAFLDTKLTQGQVVSLCGYLHRPLAVRYEEKRRYLGRRVCNGNDRRADGWRDTQLRSRS